MRGSSAMLFGKCSDFTIDNRLADNDAIAGAFLPPQMKVSSRIVGSTPFVLVAAPSTRKASHKRAPTTNARTTESAVGKSFDNGIRDANPGLSCFEGLYLACCTMNSRG